MFGMVIGHVITVCRFWCIKWLLVIGLVVAFFFIPDGSNYTFSQGYPYLYTHSTHTHAAPHFSPSSLLLL